MSLRTELYVFLQNKLKEIHNEQEIILKDDTSLVKSLLLESLALLQLSVWIERAVGVPLDFSAFDISREWDTIPDILRFIEKRRNIILE